MRSQSRPEPAQPIDTEVQQRAIGAESLDSSPNCPGDRTSGTLDPTSSRFFRAILLRSFASKPCPSLANSPLLCSMPGAVRPDAFGGRLLASSAYGERQVASRGSRVAGAPLLFVPEVLLLRGTSNKCPVRLLPPLHRPIAKRSPLRASARVLFSPAAAAPTSVHRLRLNALPRAHVCCTCVRGDAVRPPNDFLLELRAGASGGGDTGGGATGGGGLAAQARLLGGALSHSGGPRSRSAAPRSAAALLGGGALGTRRRSVLAGLSGRGSGRPTPLALCSACRPSAGSRGSAVIDCLQRLRRR